MLYIFDLGNVVINIDFTRALGVWSNLSGIPLAILGQKFHFNDDFLRHERGEISDEDFARRQCEMLDINLSYPQFVSGWQAIFIGPNLQVLEAIGQLRAQGHRVVILSNTNALHCQYWPEKYPEVVSAVDHLYLSHEMGCRKPEAAIYQQVMSAEGFSPQQTIFFDDVLPNIEAARALGITAVLVEDEYSVTDWLKQTLN